LLYTDRKLNALLDRRPAARDPEDVAAARQRLGGALGLLRRDAEQLDKLGPYRTALVQHAWTVGQRLIADDVRWLELADGRLAAGAGWTEAQEVDYTAAEERRRKNWDEWAGLMTPDDGKPD
jgi:hypothetical protein